MSHTLFSTSHPENARSQKIMVAAAFANVDVQLKVCQYGVDNETPEFARNCSPCMRLPSMQTEEGYLFESNAIMRHIARVEKSGAKLYGSTPFESSQVDMWLDFAACELDAHNHPYLMEAFAGTPAPESAMAPLEESLAGLELWLETRTFLVGERMTVADISVAFSLQWVYRTNVKHGEELTKKYRNAYRLYNTVMQQPKTVEVLKQWGATFGPMKAAKKAAEKPKAVEKKPKEAVEEEEDQPAKEEKKPNPLDALPPSNFVLDAYKREYSNTDTRTVAAPYFFQHYDAEGYTCFWARYKYNEENHKQFMTANLVRGWFQRMEHVRKYAFGIALIIGEDAAHELVSFWVFRGKGMPEIVNEVVDTELFTWEEIKNVQAEKEKITDYLCWEGPTIPRPVLEGRCFK
ncbi:hypothetical protein JKF63_06875 [Porcisia hertigi]|uniref:Elongation factor-1 gamma n=1 Tax=Porcisia hertigi TaxID=2761500 RepID=A0A836LJA6_9TRYP|nr:hypothetical protein JKF63_06875 [Porcisia hertigi]